MSFLDAFDFLDFLELFLSWRFVLSVLIGVAVGFGLYTVGGQTPSATATGVVVGIAGVVTGIVWQYRHERDA